MSDAIGRFEPAWLARVAEESDRRRFRSQRCVSGLEERERGGNVVRDALQRHAACAAFDARRKELRGHTAARMVGDAAGQIQRTAPVALPPKTKSVSRLNRVCGLRI